MLCCVAYLAQEEVALHGSHQGCSETHGCWFAFVGWEGAWERCLQRNGEQGVVAMTKWD